MFGFAAVIIIWALPRVALAKICCCFVLMLKAVAQGPRSGMTAARFYRHYALLLAAVRASCIVDQYAVILASCL